MQYQMNPQGLQSLFSNTDPGNAPAIGALYDQMRSADQLTQQDQTRQLAFDNANDPLKLRHSGLENDTLAAQLPGVTAQSNMHVRKDSNEADQNPAFLKDWHEKNDDAAKARHVEAAAQAGSRIAQVAEDVRYNPLGAHQRAKAELEKMGVDWSPEWDKMSPAQLAQHLNNYGTAVQTTSAKLQTQLDLQRLKNQPLYAAADARVAAAQARPQPGPKPEKETEWLTRMREIVRTSTDPDQVKSAKAALERYLAGKGYVAGQATNIRESGATDLGALQGSPGVPGKIAPRGEVPQPAVPDQGPTAAPTAVKPKVQGYKMDSPEGKSWLQRAQAANPKMPLDQIIQQGMASGRLN